MKISFCVTSRNRLSQISQTLEHNLKMLDGRHELALVNYGCEQGLDDFMVQFEPFMKSGVLRYFSAFGVSQFHGAKAKNLSHRLATGDILFNLDGDNFISLDMIDKIVKLFAEHPYAVMHAASSRSTDGTCGRIALHRENFYHLGGYDESFLPLYAEDTNLIERAMLLGLPYFHVICESPAPIENPVVSVSQVRTASGNKEMNAANKRFGRVKMTHEGACRRFNFSTCTGRLNLSSDMIMKGLHPATAPILPDQEFYLGEGLPRWLQREVDRNQRHRSGVRGLLTAGFRRSAYQWVRKPSGRLNWERL